MYHLKELCVSAQKNDPYKPAWGDILRDDGLLLDGTVHTPKWSFHARLGLEQWGWPVNAQLFLLKSTCAHEKDKLSFSCDIHDFE